ncbi:glutathione S-transferase [Pantoea alhagi]|uniref:Glutathione S-transferase n=1 Tax=Pantoea alhagi TaxID=1891675 RepID=A0A1W6B7A2_9GAMM|nr:glutathione S-transferase family protein [Pantoea alhagi]ARJ42939.1 glutathione S-transferase [Pantoea alhagi]
MTHFTLYGRGESGNTYKAALMLNLCGLPWTPQFVNFFNGASKAEFALSVNEMGEIPVLEFDGRRLSQSGVILEYLSRFTGRFGAENEIERLEILRWLLFDNHRFSSYYATLRMLVGLRKSGESEVTKFLRMQAENAFATVENHLKDREFIVSNRPTIADISMAGYVYFTDDTGIRLESYPQTRAWAQRLTTLPGWAHPYDLMPRAIQQGST